VAPATTDVGDRLPVSTYDAAGEPGLNA